LRGFASLNLLRLGQTARRQTLRHLPYVRKRKQPAKNAGASLRYAPSGVFFCSLRASGFGFGSGRFARSALVGCPVSALRGCLCGSSFSAVLFMSALVGFCGSRSLPSAFSPLVSSCVSAVVAAGRGVAVGCASGADRFALSAARAAGASVSLFSASSFGVGRSAFARRSAAFVSAVSASGVGCGLVAFVSSACPSALAPSSVASRCFAGFGSGSWASVAFAVGRGVPVVVFPCVSAGVSPLSVLPAWSGSWVCAGSGVWASGFRFVPSSSASLPF
jgi:hypothetical protein